MKKAISIALSALALVSLLASCAGSGTLAASTKTLKTGLGIYTTTSSSKDSTADANGLAQVDSATAVVTYDEAGKIVKCSIDAAQTRINFDAAGVIQTDLGSTIYSKKEKGADYGMIKASAIQKEWFEQINAFADWTVGKTLDEVKGLTVKKVDDSHPQVPDVPELTSSVTISVGPYINAIEKAMTAETTSFNAPAAYKSGLGIHTDISKSKDAAADAAGVGQVDSAIAVVTVDGDGKILSCTIDSAQTRVNFDNNGAITSDTSGPSKSKLELGDEYGMKKASVIGKEWYEQINAFAAWTVGKTAAEVQGLTVKKVDDSHPQVPDVPELTSSVTISVGDYMNAVVKAVENAA